jgi:hypothetical protein
MKNEEQSLEVRSFLVKFELLTTKPIRLHAVDISNWGEERKTQGQLIKFLPETPGKSVGHHISNHIWP